MSDQEILEYAHLHRCVNYEDLRRDVISTSPQIKGVFRDVLFDHIIIITQDNTILFFENYSTLEEENGSK